MRAGGQGPDNPNTRFSVPFNINADWVSPNTNLVNLLFLRYLGQGFSSNEI